MVSAALLSAFLCASSISITNMCDSYYNEAAEIAASLRRSDAWLSWVRSSACKKSRTIGWPRRDWDTLAGDLECVADTRMCAYHSTEQGKQLQRLNAKSFAQGCPRESGPGILIPVWFKEFDLPNFYASPGDISSVCSRLSLAFGVAAMTTTQTPEWERYANDPACKAAIESAQQILPLDCSSHCDSPSEDLCRELRRQRGRAVAFCQESLAFCELLTSPAMRQQNEASLAYERECPFF